MKKLKEIQKKFVDLKNEFDDPEYEIKSIGKKILKKQKAITQIQTEV